MTTIPCTDEIKLTQQIAQAVQELRRLAHPPNYDEPSIPQRIQQLKATLRTLRSLNGQADMLDLGPNSNVRLRIGWILSMASIQVKNIEIWPDLFHWDLAVWLCQQAANEIHQAFLS